MLNGPLLAVPLLSAVLVALLQGRPQRTIARVSVAFSAITLAPAALSLAHDLAQPRWHWLVAAAITLGVPFAILGLSHWLVAGDFVSRQGALILLFFGWVTGAQLLFATYRLRAESPGRLMAMVILSPVVVVAGYTVVGHAFDLFLYPDRALSDALYAAAGIPIGTFETLVVLLTVAVVVGWLVTHHAAARPRRGGEAPSPWQLALYSLLCREFYVADVYGRLADGVLAVSRRLNLWFRWV